MTFPQPTIEEIRDAATRRLNGLDVSHGGPDGVAYALNTSSGTVDVLHPSGVIVAQYRLTLDVVA